MTFCNRGSYFWGHAFVKYRWNDVIRIQMLFIQVSAMAWDAASFISSVIVFALQSSAPRKIPGKQSTLLIWFG